MNDQLDLDPIEPEFEKLWAIYRKERRKERRICLEIYRAIVSPEGRDCKVTRDGEQYTIHVHATSEEIFEGCRAYMWKESDTADRYVLHFQRFLKYATWEDMGDTIRQMNAENQRLRNQSVKISMNRLTITLSYARQHLERMERCGSDADKENARQAVQDAKQRIDNQGGNGE